MLISSDCNDAINITGQICALINDGCYKNGDPLNSALGHNWTNRNTPRDSYHFNDAVHHHVDPDHSRGGPVPHGPEVHLGVRLIVQVQVFEETRVRAVLRDTAPHTHWTGG